VDSDTLECDDAVVPPRCEDKYRLCYVCGPEGIIVAPAEAFG
jgi:hypothetical protein